MDNKEDTIHHGVSLALDDPHDGISMTEIREKNPQTIRYSVGEDGAMKFASREMKMAAELANLNIKRLYKIKTDGSVAFFYALFGDLEGATVDMLNSIMSMLKSVFEGDYEIHFMPSSPVMTKALTARVDMDRKIVYVYYEMKFEKPWNPSKEFEEVK